MSAAATILMVAAMALFGLHMSHLTQSPPATDREGMAPPSSGQATGTTQRTLDTP